MKLVENQTLKEQGENQIKPLQLLDIPSKINELERIENIYPEKQLVNLICDKLNEV